MIITICGDNGSGKNTVGLILSEKLGMKLYCIGDIRREMAKKRGITLEEYNKLGETDSSTDLEVDSFQHDLGMKEDNFIIIGRTSFHFIPNSKKIYLAVNPETGAERIFKDEKHRETEPYKDLDEAKKKLEERRQSDIRRYRKYYDIDVYDRSHYDLVIDTSDLTPEQVAEKIIKFIKK
ncbi:cytidylate kinase family protein [Candidatus Woesearchaeota archaeon]|nr:cytidylate kinase family protein [Candidatus Woesearchaeota archaeon]